MEKIFTLISTLNDAAQAGKQLENAGTWANRGQLASYFTVILTFAVTGLSLMGAIPDDVVSPEDVKTIALGVAGIGSTVVHILHVTTNPNAGK
jgi:hypothetical protein